MPHIHCYLGKQPLVWTMFITDLLIGIAYVSISLTLLALVKKIQIPFTLVILCFGVFIAACGGTHFMEVWTLWYPDYWWAALVKLVTAVASVGTGIYLYRLRHPIYQLAEAAKLSEQRRIDLEDLTNQLESRVKISTNQLIERELQFKAFFDHAIVGMAQVDIKTGYFINANACFCKLTGYTEKELQSLRPADITHPDERDLDIVNFSQISSGKCSSFESEKRYLRKNGEAVWVNLSVAAINDSTGKPYRTASVVIDITEQKRITERLRQSIEFRDQFLSIASHELRTPLTSIDMQIEMLRRRISKTGLQLLDSEIIVKALDLSSIQLKKIDRLVEDMLDISRISLGRFKITKEPVDLSRLVEDVLARFSDQLTAAKILPRFQLEQGVIGKWDRLRIEQVLSNLLSNAVKYASGKPIDILTKKTLKGSAILSIQDRGMGISKEDLARIFNRFERAANHTNISGLGLGLFITKEIIKQHKGSIHVESEPGVGSIFTVELPLTEEARMDAA